MKYHKLFYILFLTSGHAIAQNHLGNTISVEGSFAQWFGKKIELSDSKHLCVLSGLTSIVYNYRLDNSGQWFLYDSIQNAESLSSPDSNTIAIDYGDGARVFDRVNGEWVQRGPNITWSGGVEQIKMGNKDCLIMQRTNGIKVVEWNGSAWMQKGLVISGGQ